MLKINILEIFTVAMYTFVTFDVYLFTVAVLFGCGRCLCLILLAVTFPFTVPVTYSRVAHCCGPPHTVLSMSLGLLYHSQVSLTVTINITVR